MTEYMCVQRVAIKPRKVGKERADVSQAAAVEPSSVGTREWCCFRSKEGVALYSPNALSEKRSIPYSR